MDLEDVEAGKESMATIGSLGTTLQLNYYYMICCIKTQLYVTRRTYSCHVMCIGMRDIYIVVMRHINRDFERSTYMHCFLFEFCFVICYIAVLVISSGS